MRRSSAALGDALVQSRIFCSVFLGWPLPLTQLSLTFRHLRCVLFRLIPRPWSRRRPTRTPQRVGTCSSSSCTVGLPHGGVAGFRQLAGSDVGSRSASVIRHRSRPVLFRVVQTGVLIATCGTKLDHGALAVGDGAKVVADLDLPTSYQDPHHVFFRKSSS